MGRFKIKENEEWKSLAWKQEVDKVETDVKDSQDKISILNGKVKPETPLNTTSQDLSGAVNEVNTKFGAHKEEYAKQADVKLNNLIINGNFSTSEQIWTNRDASITIGDNLGVFRATATGGYVFTDVPLGGASGDIYYSAISIKSTSDKVKAGLSIAGHNHYHTGSGEFEVISSLYNGSVASTSIRIYDFRVADFDDVIVKGALHINISNVFGKNNEPTKSEMDLLIGQVDWFDGEITLSQKQILNWELAKIRANKQLSESNRNDINRLNGELSVVENDLVFHQFGKPTYGVEVMSYKERLARLPYVADEYQEVAISNPNSTIEGEPARQEGSPTGAGGDYRFTLTTTALPYIAFDYYAEDENIARIRIDFRQDDDNIFRIEKRDVSSIKIGVNRIIQNKTDVTNVIGNPAWENVTTVQVTFIANSSGTHAWRIGKLCNYKFSGKVTIWFDDGHGTVYSAAKPTMDTYGFKGVQAIIGSKINASAMLTSTRLAEMVANGWEHCNHTYYHKNLSTLSADEAEISIAKGLDYGLTHGFGKASYYLVNPQGGSSEISFPVEKKFSVLRRKGMGYNYYPIVDMYNIVSKEVTLTKPIEDIQAEIDIAITGGLWIILLFHSIRPDDFETTTNTVCKQGKFDAIMDYLNTRQIAGDLQVVTCSEALQSL